MAVDEQAEGQQPAVSPPKGLEGFTQEEIDRIQALKETATPEPLDEERTRFDYNPNADAVEQALKEATRQKEAEALKDQALRARAEVLEAIKRDGKKSNPYPYHENGITVDRSKVNLSRSLALKDEKGEINGQLDVDLVHDAREGKWQARQIIMRQNTVIYKGSEQDVKKISMAGIVTIEQDGNVTVRRIFSDYSSGQITEDISYTTKPDEDGKKPENIMTPKLASAWISELSQQYTKAVPPVPSSSTGG